MNWTGGTPPMGLRLESRSRPTVIREPREKVRAATTELLQREVAAMNLDNFSWVRPSSPARGGIRETGGVGPRFSPQALAELSDGIAGLPRKKIDQENEEAKRFDLLVLSLQLSLLRHEPGFRPGCAIGVKQDRRTARGNCCHPDGCGTRWCSSKTYRLTSGGRM